MSDYPGDRAPWEARLLAVMLALSTIATGIRFWSRIVTSARLWWDDWLALASLVYAHELLVGGYSNCVNNYFTTR
jgi:hypothetical protein